MDLTLIIPAYNEEKYIGGCLDSIAQYAQGKFREVIVVDNASTDGTAEVVSRYPWVRLVRTDKKGLTHARQAGFDASTSEYVSYIDADCRLTPSWFTLAEHYFAIHKDAAILSGPVKYYDGPYYLRALVVIVQWILLPITYLFAGYWVLGGNFVARRDAINAIGGFDTSIAFYGEDADIGRRILTQGTSRFKMDFFVYTSARRMVKEGVFIVYLRYTINFIWHTLFKRSFTEAYIDARH